MANLDIFSVLEQRYRKRMQLLAQERFARTIDETQYQQRLKLTIDEFQRALDYQNSEDTTLIPDS